MKKDRTEPYEPMVRIEKQFIPVLYICGLNTPACVQLLMNRERFTIGSNVDNDGVVNFPTMGLSEAHCVIECAEEGYTIEDLGSVNGTYINGRRLLPNTKAAIRDGDQIRLGMAVFSVDEIVQEEI